MTLRLWLAELQHRLRNRPVERNTSLIRKCLFPKLRGLICWHVRLRDVVTAAYWTSRDNDRDCNSTVGKGEVWVWEIVVDEFFVDQGDAVFTIGERHRVSRVQCKGWENGEEEGYCAC